MTSSHKSIKIIERKQRENSVADETVPFEKTAQQIERELVKTVKSWIDARRVMEKSAAGSTVSRLLQLRDNR